MPVTRRAIAGVLLFTFAVVEPTRGGMAAAQVLCDKAGNFVTEMGKRFEDGRNLVTESRALDTFAQTRYIRARLRVTGDTNDWKIVVRDQAGHALDTFSAEDFKQSGDRWTRRIPGNYALFDIFRTSDEGTHPRIVLAEYIAIDAAADRPYYSYQNAADPQLFELYTSPQVNLDEQRMGDHVGFVIVGFGTTVWTCSGVLVASNIMMTNWHCGGFKKLLEKDYWDKLVCPGIIVDFSWDDDATSSDFGCSEVLLSDKARDFAFVRIHSVSGRVRSQAGPLGPQPSSGRQTATSASSGGEAEGDQPLRYRRECA